MSQFGDDGRAHPIAFGGHALNKHQKLYAVNDLELLAVCSALKNYQHYLIGKKITIVSDSVTVQFLQKLQLASARHRRMAAYLMQFNLTTRFLRGSQNFVADCLSRMFSDLSDEQIVNFTPTDTDDYICHIRTTADTEHSGLHQSDDLREYTFHIIPDHTQVKE